MSGNPTVAQQAADPAPINFAAIIQRVEQLERCVAAAPSSRRNKPNTRSNQQSTHMDLDTPSTPPNI